MAAPPHAPSCASASLALFLDVDGTLLEIAADPESVHVPPALMLQLRALVDSLGGAVALVSGRALEALDRLFAPLVLPAAGLHGFERRDAAQCYRRGAPPPETTLAMAREVLTDLARRHPGLRVEDKRFALALHYRRAPQLEALALEHMLALLDRLAGDLELQRGKRVLELRPRGANKAAAVADFLGETPFAGRRPVYVGDDLTDEPAFELVNARGGVSVLVGERRPSAARAELPDVPAVQEWLQRLEVDPRGAIGSLAPLADAPAARPLRSVGP